jgi:hypothetical protein
MQLPGRILEKNIRSQEEFPWKWFKDCVGCEDAILSETKLDATVAATSPSLSRL